MGKVSWKRSRRYMALELKYEGCLMLRGKEKLNLVAGTSPELNQVFYYSLDSSLGAMIENGGQRGPMG